MFFFNDAATTEIYTLSLHDALPICRTSPMLRLGGPPMQSRSTALPRLVGLGHMLPLRPPVRDRKSTRLNSSHANISYAAFCLKKTTDQTSTPEILPLAPGVRAGLPV